MAKAIPNVCTPEDGLMRSPASSAKLLFPSSPNRRVWKVFASIAEEQTLTLRVAFVIEI